MTTLDLDDFRRSALGAPEFWDRTLRAVDQLSDADVHRRALGRDVKALLEEVLPLAMLARFLDMPERRIRCRYLGQDGNSSDGELFLAGAAVDLGFWAPFYYVEVTSAQFPKEHLRREALGLTGGVHADPNIRAEGSKNATAETGSRRICPRC